MTAAMGKFSGRTFSKLDKQRTVAKKALSGERNREKAFPCSSPVREHQTLVTESREVTMYYTFIQRIEREKERERFACFYLSERKYWIHHLYQVS